MCSFFPWLNLWLGFKPSNNHLLSDCNLGIIYSVGLQSPKILTTLLYTFTKCVTRCQLWLLHWILCHVYQLSAPSAKSTGRYHLLWLRTLCCAVCCCMRQSTLSQASDWSFRMDWCVYGCIHILLTAVLNKNVTCIFINVACHEWQRKEVYVYI